MEARNTKLKIQFSISKHFKGEIFVIIYVEIKIKVLNRELPVLLYSVYNNSQKSLKYMK